LGLKILKNVMFKSYIIYYIFVGLIFITLFELLNSQIKNQSSLNWIERSIIAMFWPITLLVFILAFIYGFVSTLKDLKNKNKK
jgi:TRAP-type C4-dicarboxylate transport system permease small subunit